MTNIKMNEKRYRGYTLKVSLDKSCYRHLTFPGSFTLEELADMILTAFDFDNDHLHAFFMDGKPYSRGESYYSRYAEKHGTPTNKIKVEALSLKERQKFLFLFDFGDDWQFYCEVKKITDTPEKEPYISEIVGEAPEQYPDYDEYDEYGDEDIDDGENSDDVVYVNPYVPIEPELYRAAFEFKETKPWKKIDDKDIFAVKFTDGVVGYVIVQGSKGTSCGIALYIGNDGIACLNDIINEPTISEHDAVEHFNFLLNLDCIMMTFKCKSDMQPEYVSEIQSYAKENGISLRGRNSFPDFIRFFPQKCPWSINNEKERKYLIQALEAAVELGKRLEDCSKSEFRFGEIPIIPLITKKKSGYSCGSAMLPKPTAKKYTTLVSKEEFKKFRSKVDLQCKIINLPTVMYNELANAPEYPVMMAFVETGSENAMHTKLLPYRYAVSVDMLKSFTDELIENKIFPKTISVSDERTKALLSDICERCGTELAVKNTLTVLDKVIGILFDEMLQNLNDEF